MEYIVIAALAVPIVLGLLLGMLRGSRRATLRLLLVLLCIVAAFCLKDVLAAEMLKVQIEGQTIEDLVLSMLPKEVQSLGDTVVMPIVTMLASVLLFVAALLVLELVTWIIIYPILKIFVKKARKKKDGTYGKKHGLIGGVVGLVQGAAVGLVLCITLNGLFVNVGNLLEAADGLQQTTPTASVAVFADADADKPEGGSSSQETDSNSSAKADELMQQLIAYKKSNTCQLISKTGGDKIFDFVASMKTEDGSKITLSGQLDALSGLINMGKELSALQNMDMKGGLSGDVAADVAAIFNRLDDIFQQMGDESKETLNVIAQTVANEILPDDFGFDVSAVDFKTVSFRNEGEVITELNTYKDKPVESLTEQDAEHIVETVMKSDIILPLLSSNKDFTVGLNEEQQAFAEKEIDKLASKPEADAEKIDMLKQFFGLNDGNADAPAAN